MTRFSNNAIMALTGAAPQHDLAESYGPNLSLGDLLAMQDAHYWQSVSLGYGTVEGHEELRQAIADRHDVSAGEVMTCVGAMQALYLVALSVCQPGDEVVAAAPLFPPARNVLQSVGADIRSLPLRFADRYAVDSAALAPLLTPKTKLVSLASPQNPSGVAMPKQTIAEILALMAQRSPNAYLLVDETFREAVYGDATTAPSMVSLDKRVITCASLSKCHGAPGLRVGWLINQDAKLRGQILAAKFNTIISCSTVNEILALTLLKNVDAILAARRQFLTAALTKVADWAEKHQDLISWIRPDAGALCCIRLKEAAFDEQGIAQFKRALNQADARLAEGQWFGDEARVFRLGFGALSLPALDQALQQLSNVLNSASVKAAVQNGIGVEAMR